MSNSTQNSQSRPNRSGFSTVPTTTSTHTQTESPSTRPVLVLRAEGAVTRHIQWSEDVVDNEGMGRKSSKVCCIYHKPHTADGSSSEESSSSDSDSEPDTSKARPAGGLKNKRSKKMQRHGHDHDHKHDNGSSEGSNRRQPSPNAYERVPKYKQSTQASKPSNSTT